METHGDSEHALHQFLKECSALSYSRTLSQGWNLPYTPTSGLGPNPTHPGSQASGNQGLTHSTPIQVGHILLGDLP